MRVAEGHGKGNIDEKNETTGEKHKTDLSPLLCLSVEKEALCILWRNARIQAVEKEKS